MTITNNIAKNLDLLIVQGIDLAFNLQTRVGSTGAFEQLAPFDINLKIISSRNDTLLDLPITIDNAGTMGTFALTTAVLDGIAKGKYKYQIEVTENSVLALWIVGTITIIDNAHYAIVPGDIIAGQTANVIVEQGDAVNLIFEITNAPGGGGGASNTHVIIIDADLDLRGGEITTGHVFHLIPSGNWSIVNDGDPFTINNDTVLAYPLRPGNNYTLLKDVNGNSYISGAGTHVIPTGASVVLTELDLPAHSSTTVCNIDDTNQIDIEFDIPNLSRYNGATTAATITLATNASVTINRTIDGVYWELQP